MIMLNVPYAEKDQAKRQGARWDGEKKKWYVPAGQLVSAFERWLPKFEAAGKARRPKKPRKARAARHLAP